MCLHDEAVVPGKLQVRWSQVGHLARWRLGEVVPLRRQHTIMMTFRAQNVNVRSRIERGLVEANEVLATEIGSLQVCRRGGLVMVKRRRAGLSMR